MMTNVYVSRKKLRLAGFSGGMECNSGRTGALPASSLYNSVLYVIREQSCNKNGDMLPAQNRRGAVNILILWCEYFFIIILYVM